MNTAWKIATIAADLDMLAIALDEPDLAVRAQELRQLLENPWLCWTCCKAFLKIAAHFMSKAEPENRSFSKS